MTQTQPSEDELREQMLEAAETYELEDGEYLAVEVEEAIRIAASVIASERQKAVERKLETLIEVVPHLELCENDSDRILRWANNHIASLHMPPGENLAQKEHHE